MKKIRILLSLLLCGCLSVSYLSGCTDKAVRDFVYKTPNGYTDVNDAEVAKNDKYTLHYSSDHVISLISNDDGIVWSSVPDSYLKLSADEQNSKTDLIFRSPVIIEYFDEQYEIKTAYAYESVIPNGNMTTKLIDNGIRIIYFFETAEISVPVEYILHDDGLEVRLVIKEIREGKVNKLCSVALLPGLATVKNTDSKENYIFMPSGSGTLMYTDGGKRIERRASIPVYGIDPTQSANEQIENTTECRLPVFGVRESNGGLLAVLDENSELAYIEADTGDEIVGYGYVYPTIHVRGTDTINSTDQWGSKKSISIHCENIVGVEYASVKYYPLKKYESDYVSMAKRYSEILFGDKVSEEESIPLNIQFYGGVIAEKQIIGISFDEFVKLTDLDDVKNFLETIGKEIKYTPSALLKGFGSSGVSYGKLCGDFTISKKLGGTKGFKSLKEFCENNGSKVILDVDAILFSKGANGISGVAKKVSDLKAMYNSFNIITKRSDKESVKPYILARDKLARVGNEVAEFAEEKSVNYINLSTLGKISYSDYRDPTTYCSANMSADFENFAKLLNEVKCQITSSDANAYAAKCSSVIFNVPISSSKYDGFDLDVPFYQIVFKGRTAMTTTPLNLSADRKTIFLKAIESGIGINYSVCKNWDFRLARSQNKELSFSDYGGIKTEIIENGKEIRDVCNTLHGAEIVAHQNNGEYSITTFSNGYVTIVNYGENEVNTPYGKVEPKGYILKKGGKDN